MRKQSIVVAGLLVCAGFGSGAQAKVSEWSDARYTVKNPATHETLTWIREELTLFRNGKRIFTLTQPSYLWAGFKGKDIIILNETKSCAYNLIEMDKTRRIKENICLLKREEEVKENGDISIYQDGNKIKYINYSEKYEMKIVAKEIFKGLTNKGFYYIYFSKNCGLGIFQYKLDGDKILVKCLADKVGQIDEDRNYFAKFSHTSKAIKLTPKGLIEIYDYEKRLRTIGKMYANNGIMNDEDIFLVGGDCIFNYNIVADKLSKRCKLKFGSYGPSLESDFLQEGIVKISSFDTGAITVSMDYYVDMKTLKILPTDHVVAARSRIYLWEDPYTNLVSPTSETDNMSEYYEKNMDDIKINASKIDGINFLKRSTPPRKGCGKDYSEIIKDLMAGNKNVSSYMGIDIRDDYIYAHRADQCGKFTYRFHWTDLKHPGPVILEGWQ